MSHLRFIGPVIDWRGSARSLVGQIVIPAADWLLKMAWCGLAAGLFEIGTRVLCRAIDPIGRLFLMSRHFVWLGPISNVILFLVGGLAAAAAGKSWPRFAAWFGPRLLGACMVFPALMALGPRIYPEAWALVALGIAVFLVPLFDRRASPTRRWLVGSLALMVAVVVSLAGVVFVGDWARRVSEAGRPWPTSPSPNVLFIVLDTVRADHLSLYGYTRPTTPNLERLATRGVRFDRARATAPWTLPSHASMFSGRWPHELVEQWLTPLHGDHTTLAEYLGSHGYATAGFVANVAYCSRDTGLARGFTHYEDYRLERLAWLRTAGLVEYMVNTAAALVRQFDAAPLRNLGDALDSWFLIGQRIDGATIDRAFFDWLSRRSDTGRPFLAFLNFVDAHASYIPPAGARHRFGARPQTSDEIRAVYQQWPLLDKRKLPLRYLALARDSYDDCLGYLDDQLERLFGELKRRGVLDRTLVVVTSDHGEGLGEHDLFDHGESLYRTEIQVPLVVVPPFGLDRSMVVEEAVSLRDLPATIVDLTGLGARSPFPGKSLARFWRNTEPGGLAISPDLDLVISELRAPNPLHPNRGRSPASRGPLISLANNRFVYIRNEVDGSEQLFDNRDDPQEFIDKSGVEPMRPVLENFRRQVDHFRRKSPPAPR